MSDALKCNLFKINQIVIKARSLVAKFNEESGMVVMDNLACRKDKLSCQDINLGTFAWEDKEPSCAKTHAEIYQGSASIFNSKNNRSMIVLIGNKELGSYAG